MSLKVCTLAQSWSSWKLLIPLPPRPAPQTGGEVSGETQTAVFTWLGTVVRMKAKDKIQAVQPAGTGQREGRALPCRKGSNPVGSRWELAHFWQCRWKLGKEQRLQGKQHEKGWSSAHFHPKKPHNLKNLCEAIQLQFALALGGFLTEKQQRPALLHSAEHIHNL